jgi:two-component sensor histidine kinase
VVFGGACFLSVVSCDHETKNTMMLLVSRLFEATEKERRGETHAFFSTTNTHIKELSMIQDATFSGTFFFFCWIVFCFFSD